MIPPTLTVSLDALLRQAAELTVTTNQRAKVAEIQRRLAEPLRVAIAGRVKAGKSTLLNALVGEHLAPTDAGECTKVVTWYRHGTEYDVVAVLNGDERKPLPFRRDRNGLVIDLADRDPATFQRIDVTWPSSRLRRLTLIDTPGLESLDDASAERTRRLLGLGGEEHSEVDAVIYLMRHLHRLDADFLESFSDRSVAQPSPVNAIAVLSRADEIGAGRPDALDSATIIAERYAADHQLRSLCATVIPVAGLIAETGRTLQEHEGGSLQALADLATSELDDLLLSVDRFTEPARSPIGSETRRDLLRRLGIFGVRLCVDLMHDGSLTTTDVARFLVGASGIDRLVQLLDEHFARRGELLKARSGIVNLKALLHDLGSGPAGSRLQQDLERIEAGAHEFGELRLLHLMLTNAVELNDEERAEIGRLISTEAPAQRLGMPDDTGSDDLSAAVLTNLERWRRRGSFPLTDRATAEACEIIAATYERLHTELGTSV